MVAVDVINRSSTYLVGAIEYVDANGLLQIVADTTQLEAAASCFGLLGIVTHITFE